MTQDEPTTAAPSTEDAAAPTAEYEVVVNDEEQHSIWPAGRDLPAGWRASGFRGSKAGALEHIASVWPDITPLSVRRGTGPGTS